MAILVNKKTGKEFSTNNPKAVLKRFPKTFREKSATKLNKEVAKKDEDLKKAKDIEVKDNKTDSIKTTSEKKDK